MFMVEKNENMFENLFLDKKIFDAVKNRLKDLSPVKITLKHRHALNLE